MFQVAYTVRPARPAAKPAAKTATAPRGKPAAGTTGPAPVRRPRTRPGETCTLLAVDALVVAGTGTGGWMRTAVLTLAAVVALAAAGLYRARLQFSVLDDLPRVVVAVVAVGGAWLIRPPGPASHELAIAMAAVLAGRTVAYALLRRHRRRSPGRAAVIVGGGTIAVAVAEALRQDRAYGLTPVGFVGPRTLALPTMPVLGPVDDLEKAVAKYKPLHLIVAHPAGPDSELITSLRRCRRYGVTVHVVPRLFELAVGRGSGELVRGIPLIKLRSEPAQLRRWVVKRLIDICGAAVGLVILAPVFLLCALAVKIESGRHGVLFRQERVGRDGEPFTIVKFRSLTPASETESHVTWNINTDARVGPVGRLLRRTSLDELPQLVNVLLGHMSLVGPRPERPYFVEQFRRVYAGYPDRHRVPAGMTGWAQIHGLRGDTSIEDRVRFDNHYIEHWSIWLDLKILLRTVGAMISTPRA